MSRLFVDLRPLRGNRDFSLLFYGQLVSLLGSNLTLVAVPYQVYVETHSSLWVGLASLIQLPFLIAGALWGGVMGDRMNRRTLLVINSLVLALLSAGLALNAQWHHSHLAVLITLAALAAGFGGFGGPIRSAAIPKLVPPDQLVAAYSLNQVIYNIASVAGPGLAGLLLAGIGLSACYWFDALTFALLVIFTIFMSSMMPSGQHTGVKMLRAVGDGWRYVRSHATAQAVYLVDLNAMVFGLPRALFPAVALTLYHGGPRTLGLLYAAPGAGALLMAVLTGWLERVRRQGRLVVLVVMAWGGAITVFGLVHVVWVGLACLAIAGATDVISTILRNTILQNAITDEYRSRISSIQMAVVTGGPRLGDFESGLVAGLTTTEFSIVSGGIACIVGALALIRWRPTFWNDTAL
ncbi:MAG: MFS transporter [Acidimicrobiales bacterium]|jgi:MFS family permease